MISQEEVDQVPLQVTKINIRGLEVIKDDYVRRQDGLDEVLKGRNVSEVMNAVNTSLLGLQELKLIKGAEMVLDRSEDMEENTAELNINVLENNKPYMARVSAERSMQTHEDTLNLSATHYNVFGRGESLEASLSKGAVSSTFGLNFTKPYVFNSNHTFTFGAFKSDNDRSFMQSFVEQSRGFQASLRSVGWKGQHHLEYSAAVRDLFACSPTDAHYQRPISPSITSYCRSSIKSSLNYRFIYDKRDTPLVPTKGHYFHANAELSGLGGDVAYTKAEVIGQIYHSFTDRFSMSLSLAGGVLDTLCRPLTMLRSRVDKTYPEQVYNNDSSISYTESMKNINSSIRPVSNLSDRFLMGGGLTMRGFQAGGIGPMEGSDSLGGDIYGQVVARMQYKPPVEQLDQVGLVVQSFIGAGNLQSLHDKKAFDVKNFIEESSVSCGVGIAVPVMIARLELNYSHPLRYNASNQMHSKIQFGFGIDFS